MRTKLYIWSISSTIMVHIITVKHLHDFIAKNPQYKNALEAWISIVESCNWRKPQDMVSEFGPKAVDLLGKKDNKKGTLPCKRVVFDIKGNQLRIIFKHQFHPKLKKSRLYLMWIGTHKDYDKLCDNNDQYDVSMFN